MHTRYQAILLLLMGCLSPVALTAQDTRPVAEQGLGSATEVVEATARGQAPLRNDFDGLWDTDFGPMRLFTIGDTVKGSYVFKTEATLEGEVSGSRFIFRYKEPETEGIGWFELGDDGTKLIGQWRPDGVQQWSKWTGKKRVPQPGVSWLVVLEANWEESLLEPQYAFGEMLENFFKMNAGRHVQVRRRMFHDSKDLSVFIGQVKYIAEPVVLLISTHGTSSGITVQGQTIDAATLAKPLAATPNISLLHLSGCNMMEGNFARDVMRQIPAENRFPISGYKETVSWDSSAIGDFTYLTLLLIRGLKPNQAVQQAIVASPYLGDVIDKNAPFQPLGLTIVTPPTGKPIER